MKRHLALLPSLALAACNTLAPDRHVLAARDVPGVRLSDVANHVKCELLAYRNADPKLVTLRAGGILTFTRKDTATGEAGGGVEIPVAQAGSLGAGVVSSRRIGREQTFDWPFLVSREKAGADVDCANGPPPISVTIGGRTATFQGQLLGLEAIAKEYRSIRPGDPQIRSGGFHISGAMEFEVADEKDGSLKLYVVSLKGKSAETSTAAIRFEIGTDYQEILKAYADLLAIETDPDGAAKVAKGGGHTEEPHFEHPLRAIVDGLPLSFRKPDTFLKALSGGASIRLVPATGGKGMTFLDMDP